MRRSKSTPHMYIMPIENMNELILRLKMCQQILIVKIATMTASNVIMHIIIVRLNYNSDVLKLIAKQTN